MERLFPTTTDSHQRRTPWSARATRQGLDEHGLVFTDANGLPVQRTAIQRGLRRHLRLAQLPPIRLHDLRHSFATYILRRGVPAMDVSAMLGHSKVSINYIGVRFEQPIVSSLDAAGCRQRERCPYWLKLFGPLGGR